MKARLVYIVDGQEIVLESMEFEALDQLTYAAFGKEEDIINSPRYEGKLKNLPKTGEVKVAFDTMDVPVLSIDYFSEFGFELFQKTQYMSVLVGDRKIGPTVRSVRENIIRTLCDIDVVEEFYGLFQDRYTKKEKFYHALGMLNEDDKLVFEGIKRIINDTTDHGNGYFAGRMFIEGLSKFKTVKNKDEKGRLVSPKVYKK